VAEIVQGSYHLTVLGKETIKLRWESYAAFAPGGWIGGADYAHAKRFDIGKKNMTLNLTFG
jgi:hypothetical protein